MQKQTNLPNPPQEYTSSATLPVSDKLFHMLVDSINHYALFALDIDGNVITWNNGAARLKGYSAEEIIGKHFSILYLPQDIADGKPQRELEIAQKEGKYEEEGLRVRKDGSCFWANVVISPMWDAEGRLRGYAKATHDISARKQAEASLHSTMAIQQAIFNCADYTIISTDLDGTIRTFNRAAERLLGYTAEEIVNNATPSIFHDRQEVAQRAEEFSRELGIKIEPGFEVFVAKCRSGISDENEWTYIHKDGRRFPITLSITALYDTNNNVINGFLGVGKDISERKRSEQAFQEIAERLQLATDSGGLGVWEYNIHSHQLDWNDQMLNLYGFTRETFPGAYEAWEIRLHPDDKQRSETELQVAIKGGKKFDTEFRIVLPDGKVRYLKANAIIVMDEKGLPTRMIGLNHDITARKLTEQTLQDSQKKLILAQQVAHMGSWDYNLQQNHITWSEEMFHLLGLAPEQGVPDYATYLSFYSPEDAVHLDVCMQQAITEGKDYELDLRCAKSLGQLPRWYHAVGKVERNADGQVVSLFGTLADITERKEIERQLEDGRAELEMRVQERTAALRDSEASYRFMADAMPQIVWTSKPDGSIEYYNKRWYDYTGMDFTQAKEWEGKPVLHPGDLQTCLERWTTSLRTGQPYEVEYRILRTQDGQYRWHLDRALPRIGESGEIVQWVGTCTDIEDYKQAEASLRQTNDALEVRVKERTAELERSNADLEQFAYVASHDLQEPLRMVSSYMSLLSRRYTGKLDADADEFIAYAVDGAVRMQRLISDLLVFSRVGTQGKQFMSLDMGCLVEDAILNLQMAIRESSAQVTYSTLPMIFGDKTQLLSLLQNLIGNALKYRGDSCPSIHISAQHQAGETVFSVRDNGIGIDPQYFERIFVIFQRLHGKGEYSGTGVGLALCKKIVGRHGGRIWVVSEPGNGSTFAFTLPEITSGGTKVNVGTHKNG